MHLLQPVVPAMAVPDAQLGVQVGLNLHALLGALGLHLEIAQPRLDLAQDILHPLQVVAGFFQLAQGGVALA